MTVESDGGDALVHLERTLVDGYCRRREGVRPGGASEDDLCHVSIQHCAGDDN